MACTGRGPSKRRRSPSSAAINGFSLLGVYVFGGSQGANLYKVDLAQLISGSAIVNTPLTGNSGKYAEVSHMLFLGTSGHSVPEAGSTLALLALASGTSNRLGMLAYFGLRRSCSTSRIC
jgi:hypothetical protein